MAGARSTVFASWQLLGDSMVFAVCTYFVHMHAGRHGRKSRAPQPNTSGNVLPCPHTPQQHRSTHTTLPTAHHASAETVAWRCAPASVVAAAMRCTCGHGVMEAWR